MSIGDRLVEAAAAVCPALVLPLPVVDGDASGLVVSWSGVVDASDGLGVLDDDVLVEGVSVVVLPAAGVASPLSAQSLLKPPALYDPHTKSARAGAGLKMTTNARETRVNQDRTATFFILILPVSISYSTFIGKTLVLRC